MPAIHFRTKPFTIHNRIILLLPKDASAKLPSRGMVMVKGNINDFGFQTPLEPDGRGSHWFEIDRTLRESADITVGEPVTLEIEPTKTWPEPDVPADVKSALAGDRQARALWEDVTPMARWDWLRWISSTGKSETRKKRIEVALSKLKAGNRRPCCFNRTICTDPSVSKGGALLEPEPTA